MTDHIDLHLGRRLRQRRQALGFTQDDVAVAVGVRFQQIQKYECGDNRISAARLWALSRILKMPVEDFFAGLEAAEEKALLTQGEPSPPS